MKRRTRPVMDRIAEKTVVIGECHLWTGGLNRDGYAPITANGRQQMAHRVAYELTVGPIPPGLDLDHLCNVRACVNPAHLEPVTKRVNALRRLGSTVPDGYCYRGHLLDETNAYRQPSTGVVRCRVCNRMAVARYQARREATR